LMVVTQPVAFYVRTVPLISVLGPVFSSFS
jgi:hypothetical protein